MAKRKNRLVALFIVLLIFSLTTVVVKNIKVEKEKIANIEKTVIDIDSGDINEISWTYSGSSLSFNKNDDIWYLTADEEFPVDQDAIKQIIEDVSKVDVSFIIEEVSDYSQYGLSNVDTYVTFKTADNEFTIKFGNYSSMDEERYVDIDDGNVYLLTTDIMDDFDKEVGDFFAYEEVPDMTDFKEMIVSGETNLDIIYDDDNSYTYSKLFTYFLKNKNNKTLGNDEVENLANKIVNIEFEDYATYTANNDDLSTYGLDEPRISVKFNYVDEDDVEQNFIIHLSSDVIVEDEDDDSANYYARIDGSDNVYCISETVFNAFKDASYDTLRPSEVLLLDFKDVKQIDIELDDEDYSILTEVKDDEITYSMNEQEISFGDVVDDIENLSISEYTNDIPDKAMQLSLKLYLDNEKYPTLTIKIYKYSSESSLLLFNDSYKALVSRQDVVDLIEDINAAVLD